MFKLSWRHSWVFLFHLDSNQHEYSITSNTSQFECSSGCFTMHVSLWLLFCSHLCQTDLQLLAPLSLNRKGHCYRRQAFDLSKDLKFHWLNKVVEGIRIWSGRGGHWCSTSSPKWPACSLTFVFCWQLNKPSAYREGGVSSGPWASGSEQPSPRDSSWRWRWVCCPGGCPRRLLYWCQENHWGLWWTPLFWSQDSPELEGSEKQSRMNCLCFECWSACLAAAW